MINEGLSLVKPLDKTITLRKLYARTHGLMTLRGLVAHCLTCNKELPEGRLVCGYSCAATYRNNLIAQKSIEAYLENPNLCLYCGNPILPSPNLKLVETKRKKFCNRSCSARYSNRDRDQSPTVRECRLCHKPFTVNRMRNGVLSKSQLCRECKRIDTISNLTLAELFEKRKNWQSARTGVRNHAWLTYERSGRPMVCAVCGYDKHIDVCHVAAVSDFAKTTLIRDVNCIDNLIALCPNHHWEYDNGLLQLNDEK